MSRRRGSGALPSDWWRRHGRVASLLTAGAVLALLVVDLAAPAQLALLAFGVAVLGVPHGALDHRLGRVLLEPRLGAAWPAVFGAAYLGLASLVVVAWSLVPLASLVVFLAVSAIHFGLGDVRRRLSTSRLHPFEVVARGALPILVPVWAHAGEVAVLFGWLVGDAVAPTTRQVALWASGTALGLAPALAWVVAHHLRRALERRPGHAEVLAEIALLVALGVVAPPLVAFAIYFCCWHSLRHSLETMAAEGLAPRRFVRLAAPLTLATLALAAIAWTALRRVGTAVDPALVQVVFIGLAALTVPHMILCSIDHRRP
ncbi:MAG: Brp/Blh family beta-carotene 15,15'-dioxygenase [Acidobacteriota bacterium]